ncbi:MAG: type III-A CRISPR-associated RAMP protein Csm3 [Candidatus Schekmanbacteria bacterium]|nr:MAG: type III-A CRISPR-associated RAMP protein Csm3 [Candidatus Schekmanbacteria bacterium]
MKLMDIKKIEGKIKLLTGLHIGGGGNEMHIGGIDNPVVKHPHTMEPYIPGSSLKGKVRSLLEMQSGLIIHTGGSVLSGSTLKKLKNDEDKEKCKAILKIFGSSGADKDDESEFGPTRVSFADCYLNAKWKENADNKRLLLTETKSENSINRIKGTAENPRFIERVPAGAEFDFSLTFKILEESDNVLFNKYLLNGLKLLEMDCLGGSGSRGYGRISFTFEKPKDLNNKFRELNPFQ